MNAKGGGVKFSLSGGDEQSEPESQAKLWPSPVKITVRQSKGPEGERGEAAPPLGPSLSICNNYIKGEGG